MSNIKETIKNLEANEIKDLEQDYAYLDGLNDKQKIAATRLQGNYLVIAGPGSGKTHTIIYRTVHLIKQGVQGKEIVIVTFTRKAAQQLKERIAQLLPDVVLGFVGTFHAFANYLISSRGLFKGYRLIDPEDDNMILNLVVDENRLERPLNIKTRTLNIIFSYSVNAMMSLEETLVKLNKEELIPELEQLEKIFKTYQRYKFDNQYMNYDDIMMFTREYLKKNIIKNHNFKYLMIDEYQDTNNMQISFIKSLNIENVMAIGDDFQSIYSFRAANNEIILNFYNDFSNAKMIKLDINYRSTPEIVQAENMVTDASDFGYKKALISNRLSGPKIEIKEHMEHSEDILKQLKERENQSNAIIYRYNNSRKTMESLLLLNKIDYVVYGGLKLLDRKHIKDIFAIILTNQNKNDMISFLRSYMLLEGLGNITAKKIYHDPTYSPNINGLAKLNEIIYKEYDNLQVMLKEVIEYYLTLNHVVSKSYYDLSDILDDFETIQLLASNYHRVTNFINDIILDSNLDKFSNKEKKANVVLTTIHSAKGLEFDNVYFLYERMIYSLYNESNLEEDRRMFYVAISRAKNNLTIYDLYNNQRTFLDIINDFNINPGTRIDVNAPEITNIEKDQLEEVNKDILNNLFDNMFSDRNNNNGA